MSWDGLLKSVETDGGKLFVTIGMIFFVIAVALIIVLLKVQLQETGRTELASFLSLLVGVLIGHLKPSGPSQK